jgi:hypothetical protein
MSEIKRRDLEWVAVERISDLLTTGSGTQHDVTYVFCLFGSLVAWIRQRVGAYRSFDEWPFALKPLRSTYTSGDWNKPEGIAEGADQVSRFFGARPERINLPSCSAWDLLIVLRNSTAHADSNGVCPINAEAPGQRGRLIGYEFTRRSGRVNLNKFEMISFGSTAAKVYLEAFRPTDAALREMQRAA